MRFSILSLLVLTAVIAIVFTVLPWFLTLDNQSKWLLVFTTQGLFELSLFSSHPWFKKPDTDPDSDSE